MADASKRKFAENEDEERSSKVMKQNVNESRSISDNPSPSEPTETNINKSASSYSVVELLQRIHTLEEQTERLEKRLNDEKFEKETLENQIANSVSVQLQSRWNQTIEDIHRRIIILENQQRLPLPHQHPQFVPPLSSLSLPTPALLHNSNNNSSNNTSNIPSSSPSSSTSSTQISSTAKHSSNTAPSIISPSPQPQQTTSNNSSNITSDESKQASKQKQRDEIRLNQQVEQTTQHFINSQQIPLNRTSNFPTPTTENTNNNNNNNNQRTKPSSPIPLPMTPTPTPTQTPTTDHRLPVEILIQQAQQALSHRPLHSSSTSDQSLDSKSGTTTHNNNNIPRSVTPTITPIPTLTPTSTNKTQVPSLTHLLANAIYQLQLKHATEGRDQRDSFTSGEISRYMQEHFAHLLESKKNWKGSISSILTTSPKFEKAGILDGHGLCLWKLAPTNYAGRPVPLSYHPLQLVEGKKLAENNTPPANNANVNANSNIPPRPPTTSTTTSVPTTTTNTANTKTDNPLNSTPTPNGLPTNNTKMNNNTSSTTPTNTTTSTATPSDLKPKDLINTNTTSTSVPLIDTTKE